MLTIRQLEHQPASVLAMMPNELMFLIFSYLPWNDNNDTTTTDAID
jgi:hypothetical protein